MERKKGRLFIEIRHFSPFHREKVKAMLLAAEVMLLHAEAALLQLEAQP